MEKTCPICKKRAVGTKAVKDFFGTFDRNGKEHPQSYCRQCRSKRKQQIQQNKKETYYRVYTQKELDEKIRKAINERAIPNNMARKIGRREGIATSSIITMILICIVMLVWLVSIKLGLLN